MRALILLSLLFALVTFFCNTASSEQIVSLDQYTQLSKVKICKDLTVTGEEWPEKSFLELDSAEGSAAEVLDSESEPEELGIRGEHSSIPVYRTVNVELLNRVTPELIILLAAF